MALNAAMRPAAKTFTIDELRASAADALGTVPGFYIKISGQDPVVIPHPLFLDEDRQVDVEKIQGDDDAGNIALALAVLGEAEHKRYIAAGGRSNDVAAAWAVMRKQMTDILPGEKTPTQSST